MKKIVLLMLALVALSLISVFPITTADRTHDLSWAEKIYVVHKEVKYAYPETYGPVIKETVLGEHVIAIVYHDMYTLNSTFDFWLQWASYWTVWDDENITDIVVNRVEPTFEQSQTYAVWYPYNYVHIAHRLHFISATQIPQSHDAILMVNYTAIRVPAYMYIGFYYKTALHGDIDLDGDVDIDDRVLLENATGTTCTDLWMGEGGYFNPLANIAGNDCAINDADWIEFEEHYPG